MTISPFVPVGRVTLEGVGAFLQIDRPYRDGLVGLEAFRWILVLWLAHLADQGEGASLTCVSPYRGGPERLGVFATRSPRRPNPICVTAAALTGVDVAAGQVRLGWIDCADGTPVLDIKPYQASCDRVERPRPPGWCAGWPSSVETSGDFDWTSVFTT
jgi:tRNA-Thr(GGU) m(6)t(6)A37 methyltransferase TsaA